MGCGGMGTTLGKFWDNFGDPQRQKGIAAVEYALVLPFLTLLLFGIIDFGTALYNREVLTNASREGARAGIILSVPRPSVAEVNTVVEAYLTSAGLNSSEVSISVNVAGVVTCNDLSVALTYNYPFLVLSNLLPSIPDSIPITVQTVMKLE